MIAFLSSALATVAVAVAGMLGFHLHSAPDSENPLREWKDRQALCQAPHNARVASICELLQDEPVTSAP